jgi:radial spoke head protein 9
MTFLGLLQVALDSSLPVKRAESGLRVLNVWGRLLCVNGKVLRRTQVPGCSNSNSSAGLTAWHLLLQDYIIAEGFNSQSVKGKTVKLDCKYFFTQDGARWASPAAADKQASERET